MVNQREGPLGEAAMARRQGRIKEPFAGSSRYRYHAHQRKTLVADDVWIAHHNAGPHTMLFATQGGIEFHHHHCATTEFHSCLSAQPLPATHSMGLPRLLSTSASASSAGKLRVHASSPSSASSAHSG